MGLSCEPLVRYRGRMQKSIVRSVLWGLLSVCGACTETPKCDVSTDEAVRALYHKLTSEELDTRHSCLERSGTFAGVVRLGSFAHDHGCKWNHIISQCQIDPPNAAQQAMAQAGWNKADARTRQKLALAWMTEVEGVDLLRSQPSGWPKDKACRDPDSTPTPDGGLVVRYWVSGRQGKSRARHYWQSEVPFDRDGSHRKAKTIDEVSIEIETSDF